MARFLTLALLAVLAVAEVAAVVALVDVAGATTALLLLILDVLVGLYVLRWGARSQPPARGWRMAGGAIIAIPGFVLNVVGGLLLIPALQRWVSGHVLRSTTQALRKRGVSIVTVTDATGAPRTTVVPGAVIPGEVIDPEAQAPTHGEAGGAPGSAPGRAPDHDGGPPVVRGEIVSPDD